MGTIVYYGVGKNLEHSEKYMIAETGIPVCLVDRDPQKQGTTYCFNMVHNIGGEVEERPIYALNDVKREYPDYELYITLENRNIPECYRGLIEDGVERCRIKFFGDGEYRLGCDNMNYYCYVQSTDIRACAHFPYRKSFFYDKEVLTIADVKKGIEKLEKWRVDTIERLRRGEETSCDGCSALYWGMFTKKPKITVFAVGPNFAGGTKCNCNCFYCNQNQDIKSESNQVLSNYDIHKIGGEVYKDIENIILADGEPSLLPHLNELCELVDEKGWSVNFNTNAIIYSEKLADTLAKNKNSFMAVALDSGSRKIYKKIKRVDKFNKVIENLRRYRDKGCKICMKYILIPDVNDSVEEMNAFIKIAKEIDVMSVTLSQNMSNFSDGVAHDLDPDMSESMFASFTYLVARLQEEKIPWDFQIEFISQHDIMRIEKLRRYI